MSGILCLLYHRVNPVNDPIFKLTVSPENFDKHMQYIRSHFPILRFEENWTEYSTDSVVVTFDDGYADNYEYALPILEKYHIPATIFVSTGYVNSIQEYWWDELARLLTLDQEYPEQFELIDPLYHYKWDTGTKKKRLELAQTMHWLLKMEPNADLAKEWFRQLRIWGNIEDKGRKENLPLNIKQLGKLSQSEYITIGGHTVNHISLGALSKNAQQFEIGASVNYLRKQLNKRIETFSYPFGSAVHYNTDTIEICKQNRIRKAATTRKGIWHIGDDSYQIPRNVVDNYSESEFIGYLQGVWEE